VPSANTPSERATELAEIVSRIRAILLGDGSDGPESKPDKDVGAPPAAPEVAPAPKVTEPETQASIDPGRARLLRLVILADKVFGNPEKRVNWLTQPLFDGKSVVQLIDGGELGARFEDALHRIYEESQDARE